MKCHDPLQVVDELLEEGADPNLPLGRGVGTALCIITTHTTLKKRGISSSLALVSRSLSHNLPWHQSITHFCRCHCSSDMEQMFFNLLELQRVLSLVLSLTLPMRHSNWYDQLSYLVKYLTVYTLTHRTNGWPTSSTTR